MSNNVSMYIYDGITMHNGIAMNLYFYHICIIMPMYIILLWVVCSKNKNKFVFDQSGFESIFIDFVLDYFTRPTDW